METKKNHLPKKSNKRLFGILLGIATLLSIPLIAMQFSDEVNWDLFDFLIMGTLLLATGISCELALRKIIKPTHRIILCAILLIALFLVWAELAVGIFGSPIAGS